MLNIFKDSKSNILENTDFRVQAECNPHLNGMLSVFPVSVMLDSFSSVSLRDEKDSCRRITDHFSLQIAQERKSFEITLAKPAKIYPISLSLNILMAKNKQPMFLI